MAFIPVPNCIELVYEFLLRNHTCVVALTYNVGGDPSVADLQVYAEYAQNTVWDTLIRPAASVDLQIILTSARQMSVADGLFYINPILASSVGAVDSPSIGNNQAPIISWRTPYTGRSFRGRTFFPGVPLTGLETPNTIGTILQGQLNDIADGMAGLPVAPDAPNGSLVVVSRVSAGVPRTTAVTTPVESWIIPFLLGTQRRRMKEAN